MRNLILMIALFLAFASPSWAQVHDSVVVDFGVLDDLMVKKPEPAPLPPVAATPEILPPLPSHKPDTPVSASDNNILVKIEQEPLPAATSEKLKIKQETSAPKAKSIQLPENIRFIYSNGEISPPENIRPHIEQKLIPLFKQSSSLRAALYSYATAADDGQSSARRISLARAIAFREFLINNDIDPSRIDLLPRGNQTDTLPKDRIDVQFIAP